MGVVVDYTDILKNIQSEQETIIEMQQLLLEALTTVVNLSTENQENILQLIERFEDLAAASQEVESAESQIDTIMQDIRQMEKEIDQSQALYSNALMEQSNFFKRLMNELQSENKTNFNQAKEQSEQLFQYMNKTSDQLQHLDEIMGNSLNNQGDEAIKTQFSDINDKLDKCTESLSAKTNELSDELSHHSSQFEESLNQIYEHNKEMSNQVNNISHSNEGIHQYLSSLEELMRLIAANQLLSNTESDNKSSKVKSKSKVNFKPKFDFKTTKQFAESGNVEAMYELGLMYLQGIEIGLNRKKAVEWLREAADQGNIEAMRKLGECYENGWGISKSKSNANYWYRKANEAENN